MVFEDLCILESLLSLSLGFAITLVISIIFPKLTEKDKHGQPRINGRIMDWNLGFNREITAQAIVFILSTLGCWFVVHFIIASVIPMIGPCELIVGSVIVAIILYFILRHVYRSKIRYSISRRRSRRK